MTPETRGYQKKLDDSSKKNGLRRWYGAIFKKDLQHIAALVGILAAVVSGTFYAMSWIKMNQLWSEVWPGWLVAVLSSTILIILLHRKRQQLAKAKETLTEERDRAGQPAVVDPPKFKRFEDISSNNKVVAGPLEYPPLLKFEHDSDMPWGIAVDLLDRVFGRDNWTPASKRRTWGDLAQVFDTNKACDIVATPVFATNRRARSLSFTSPIFFADIGLYVNPENPAIGLDKDESPERSLKQAIKTLRHASSLRTQVITGEISENLTVKHLTASDITIVKLAGGDTSLAGLIGLVAKPHPSEVDFVFAERLIADRTPQVRDGRVVNLLKPAQLTYPVVFAMHPKEYVLRNFVNLRLMEIDQQERDGIVGLLVEFFNRNRTDELDLETGKRYFIRSFMDLERPKVDARGPSPTAGPGEPSSGEATSGSRSLEFPKKRGA